MDIVKKIKAAEGYSGIPERKLAELLNTSPSAFNQRMKTGKFTGDELEQIASALGCRVEMKFIFKDGTEI